MISKAKFRWLRNVYRYWNPTFIHWEGKPCILWRDKLLVNVQLQGSAGTAGLCGSPPSEYTFDIDFTGH